MHRFFFTLLATLALGFTASAQTIQVPVTPNHLIYSNFTFAVTVKSVATGVAFHIAINSNNGIIPRNSATSVAIITGGAKSLAIAGVKPAPEVTMTKDPLVWQADFTAADEVLNQPGVMFILVVMDYTITPDGQKVYLPSDRIYEITLQDFLTP